MTKNLVPIFYLIELFSNLWTFQKLMKCKYLFNFWLRAILSLVRPTLLRFWKKFEFKKRFGLNEIQQGV